MNELDVLIDDEGEDTRDPIPRDYPVLTEPFRSHGFDFDLIAFSEGWHLFRKRKGPICTYEIVLPVWQRAWTAPNGKDYAAKWAYPSAETWWGTRGFSYQHLDNAKHHLAVAEQYEMDKTKPVHKLTPKTKKEFLCSSGI